MNARIYGLETEYGITCAFKGQRRLTPDEVARYLFRSVVAWGRSSNVFLENGGRLYLDVGSHPEFATPECDDIRELIAYDQAGDAIVNALVDNAEARLLAEGIRGSVHIFKNNTDSAGNSYGCHENYSIRRDSEPQSYDDVLVPFLVSRQLICGAGKILSTSRGPMYSISQRAEHIWEGMSSATTRSRPIINTRDEPHADAEVYRRLHVIVGDSNMSQYSSYLKVGSTACVLRMIEDRSFPLRSLELENPIRAIRDISLDPTCKKTVKMTNGREMSGLDIQRYLLDRAHEFADAGGFSEMETAALSVWTDAVSQLENDPLTLGDKVDWVTKFLILDRFCQRQGCDLADSRAQMIDLQYHDINPERGLYNRIHQSGLSGRIVTKEQIARAQHFAPTSTRAHLRGRFIREAKDRGRDYTVDWVNLKINDQSQRTVVCKDPFRSSDERVDRLIASL